MSLPYQFFTERSAGDLLMRTNSNVTIRELITSSALSALLDGTLVSIYLILLLVLDARIGVLVAALTAVRVLTFLVTRRAHFDRMTESLMADARSRGAQADMIWGVENLKASGSEHRAIDRWLDQFVRVLNANIARGTLEAQVNAVLDALKLASPLAVLLYGASLVLGGVMSLGQMLALAALAGGLLVPVSALITTAFQLQLLRAYFDRLDDVLECAPEQAVTSANQIALAGAISVEGVSFRYQQHDRPLLDNVSFTIEPGQFVAIVGRSGSGKSTLVRLLLGLYAPASGRICYDGRDLAMLDRQAVRSQIGTVLQDVYLFGTSIRENIAISIPSADLRTIRQAARLANVHDDIMRLPWGYDTMVADRGASLSGGMRQRIALARALLSQPRLLVLDEATSALDVLSEQRLQRSLGTMACTRVVVAHRLSTIRDADLILVMAGGRIVESGRHASLMALGGDYASLVSRQEAGALPSITPPPLVDADRARDVPRDIASGTLDFLVDTEDERK